ncbi:MAG TPA: BTAD domain-containing putative transcriptional regulator [Acidimicrobiia bacterium]|nr:BTAD domain-containing putative transcriptional regulator [Acidimicrobiia bacterium]
MDVGVLGPIEAWVADDSVELGGPKQRGLLGLLVAAAPGSVSTDALIEGIWGEEPSSGARSTLQTYVSNLRQVLGPVLTHERGGYRLNVEPDSIDANRFRRLLEEGRATLATDAAATARLLREALSLWRGRPYADLLEVPGLDAEIRRLEELRLEAVELRIDAELTSGLHGGLVAESEALAEEYPMRERFRAQHMLALYRSGRQAEALRAYRRTESFLAEELGVEPSAELQDLELAILQHDDSLLGGVGRAVTQRLAFLVTDIEGSTRLWDRDPQEMAAALVNHDALLRDSIEEAGGRVFKHTGDGVLATFPDAIAAVRGAEAALRSLAGADWGALVEMRVRIGIDVGEVETRGGDFFGPPVNRAARLCAIGHGGQVLISAAAQAEVSAAAPTGLQVRHLGEVHLRGMATPEPVAQLVFVGLQADFPDLRVNAETALDERLEVESMPGYEVRDRIGEGAFGVVWRAYQPSVGREVAIKVIRPELASQPSFVRRFEAEARTIARLAHPHIVPLIDFWRDADTAYLVLALLPGGSLAHALAEDEIDRAAARRIIEQIGAALDHAHSQQMVHGDVNPGNVLLDGAGNAYLSDFGLTSRLLYPELTQSVSSSPAYRAPEEERSGPSALTDVFALGTLARDLLDGEADLEPVLSRATASRPEDRYPSPSAFLADLNQALGGEPTEMDFPVVSRNPYKGLRAFDEGDSADFHGRDELITTLLAALTDHRFVTVVGPSGSGKSSVVRAGLLPALASGRIEGSREWFRIHMTPGVDPVAALVEAIDAYTSAPVDYAQLVEVGVRGVVESEIVLVIDQFEELFTLADPTSREMFLELLADTAENPRSGVRVVATLRADFYDRPLEHGRIGRLVRDGLVTVLRPTREELVEMIMGPSQAVGLRWEPGLPHRIAEDVAHQAGGLPLLQYALTELVERRSSDLLTSSDYTGVGGVAGALANRAEGLFRGFTPAQQETARQVFLRLVTVDEDTDDTRRRVRRSELESMGIPRSDLEAVLDRLTRERLLLADRDPATRGPTVEVAHEALLREWPRLADWVDDQREALILGRRFRAALGDWDKNGRHDDYLLTGGRLAPFTGWAETASLTVEEQDYYQRSLHKDQVERAARRRRRRTLTGVLAGAAIVASALGVIAAVQANRASNEAVNATRERDRALTAEARAGSEADRATVEADNAWRAEQVAASRELAASAISVLESDSELAVLLGLEALELAPDDDVLPTRFFTAFHSAIHGSRTLLDEQWEESTETAWRTGEISPDGTRIVATSSAWSLEMWDAGSGQVLWGMSDQAQGGWFSHPHFSPDGAILAAAFTRYWSDDKRVDGGLDTGVYLLAAESGEILEILESPTECDWVGLPAQHTFSHDGARLIRITDPTECFDGNLQVEVVDLATGEVTHSFDAAASQDEGFPAFLLAGFDAADTVLILSDLSGFGGNPATKALALDSGAVVWEAESTVASFLSPDGSILASAIHGPAQLDIDLVDPVTGEVLGQVSEERSFASDMVFNGDGSYLYTGKADGSVGVWDTATFRKVMDIASTADLARMSVDRSGSTLALIGSTGLRTFDLTSRPLGEMMAHDFRPYQVASWGLDTGGDLLAVFGFHGRCPEQFSEVLLMDAATGEVADRFYDIGGNTLLLTPDGSRLIKPSSSADGPDDSCSEVTVEPIRVTDTATGMTEREFEGLCSWLDPQNLGPECVQAPNHPYPQAVTGMSTTADGSLVAATGWLSPAFSVWDAESGSIVLTERVGEGDCCLHDVSLHPDGLLVAVTLWEDGSVEPQLVVYDLDGNILHEEPGSAGPVQFSPDGRHLATSVAEGNRLRVYDTETWGFWEVDAHPDFQDLDVSPNGEQIVTVGTEGSLKVWDVSERSLAHEIDLGSDFAKAVAFVDDQHVAIGTQEGLVAVLTLDPRELMDIARSRVSRSLTEQECQTYLHGSCP